MQNQIQIASEPKDSKLASTLAHETRKNNAGRILFLSLCVVVTIAGAAIITACNGDKEDKNDPSTSVITSINAEVDNVNSSVTTVRLGYYDAEDVFTSIGQGTFSNGRINVNLSEIAVPAAHMRSIANTFVINDGVNISNNNARVARFDELVGYDADNKRLGKFQYLNVINGHVQNYGILVYSDSDVTVTEGFLMDAWEVSLKTGWNFVYSGCHNTAGGQYNCTRTTIDRGGMKWYWEEEIAKENYYLQFSMNAFYDVNIGATETVVELALTNPKTDTLFLIAANDWNGIKLIYSQELTANIKFIMDIDKDRLWGGGTVNPDEISKADSTYLASRKFEVQAQTVIAD